MFEEKNRTHLEDDMTACWYVVDDLRTVADTLYDSDKIDNPDTIHTLLSGIAELYDCKFAKLMDTHRRVFKIDQYAPFRWHNDAQ